MNKLLVRAMDLFVVCAASLTVAPVVREHLHWSGSRVLNTPKSYNQYLREWPTGSHAVQAGLLHDEAIWSELAQTADIGRLKDYVRMTTRDAHKAEANEKIDRLRYAEAKKRNTVRSFQRYLEASTEGKFVIEAKSKQRSLLADSKPYSEALAKATAAAMIEFIEEFPGHAMQGQARIVAKDLEGRDIFDLLREGKIHVVASALGAESVSVSLTRKTGHPLVAKVDAGTLFMPRNPNWRQMIATIKTSVLLKGNSPVLQTIAAASVQQLRALPPLKADSYSIRPASTHAQLAKLTGAMADAKVTNEVAQAAVWIVSLNADFAALGSMALQGRVRTPREEDVALAMQIVDRAGLNVTSRAIWRDRQRIAGANPRGELRTWLEQRK